MKSNIEEILFEIKNIKKNRIVLGLKGTTGGPGVTGIEVKNTMSDIKKAKNRRGDPVGEPGVQGIQGYYDRDAF